MTDTQSFLCATSIIIMCAIGSTQIVDSVKRYYSDPVVMACAIEYRGNDGNKHVYVGSGEAW